MKKLFVIAMFVGVCGLAKATTFTESNSYAAYNGGNGIEVYNNPYTGTFTNGKLKSGSTVFNKNLYTITSADLYVTMVNAANYSTELTIDGITLTLTPKKSPQVLDFQLTAMQYNYIQSNNGTFSFQVEADCYFQSAELVVNTTPVSQGSPVPDMATTMLLLGSSLLGLEVLRRKVGLAKA